MFDFFYSDPHYYHNNIIKYCNRPFADPPAMNVALINNFNSRVNAGDKVLWLGDCFFCGMKSAEDILRNLNGEHFLISGNHDKKPKKMLDIGFSWVAPEFGWYDLGLDMPIRACHYPTQNYYDTLSNVVGTLDDFKEYDETFKPKRPKISADEVLLHGHVHVAPKYHARCVNISCDVWDYCPVSYKQLTNLINESLNAE